MSANNGPTPGRRRTGRRPGFRASIVLKLASFVAVLVFLAAGAMGGVGYFSIRRVLLDQIHARLSVVVSDRNALLLAYIDHQRERIALLASRTRLRHLLHDLVVRQTTIDETTRVELKHILDDVMKSTPDFQDARIIDPAGKVLIASDPGEVGKNLSADPDFRWARGGGGLGVPWLVGGTYRAALAGPFLDDAGRVVGVFLVSVDADAMAASVSNKTGLGETGEVMIGTRAGDRIHYVIQSRQGRAIEEMSPADVPAMAAAIAGRKGFLRARDYRGENVLTAYRPVGYRDWGLVAKIDVAEAYAPVVWLRDVLLTLGGGVLAAGFLASYLLARRFTGPILSLADKASAVAGGDLKVRADVTSGDELGVLGIAFNCMTQELAESQETLQRRVRERGRMLETLRAEVAKLAATSVEIVTSTRQQSTGARQQASSLAQTVATVNEVAEAAKKAADRARSVGDESRRSAAMGRDGRKAVDDSIAAMDAVRDQVEGTADHIVSLAQQAQAIDEIISTVVDIAEQTNLLALNAAIEASRAGEHGKGFAVVAREVKALADQAKKATAQARQILGSIKQAANTAVLATEQGTKAVNAATGVVVATGETIKAMAETMAKAAGQAEKIEASAAQQAAGMAQINQAIHEINQLANQNVEAIRQIEAAAEQLNAISTRLADSHRAPVEPESISTVPPTSRIDARREDGNAQRPLRLR